MQTPPKSVISLLKNGHKFGCLLSLCFLSFVNGGIWITFSPVAYSAACHFGVPVARINLLSTAFLVTYFPLCFCGCWLGDKWVNLVPLGSY
jgi:hypothetical protein